VHIRRGVPIAQYLLHLIDHGARRILDGLRRATLLSLGGRGRLVRRVGALISVIGGGPVGEGVDGVGAAVLDEGGQVLDRARALVRDRRVLLARREQLDRREARDLVRHVVGRRVDLRDRHLRCEWLEELA